MKFDKQLRDILIRQDFDNFTVPEAMDEYSQFVGLGGDVDRNWMYGQLRRLTVKGMLEKERQVSSNRVTYKKTKLFNVSQLEPQISSDEAHRQMTPTSVTDERFIELMTERAKSLKVDLLASISEGDEYKALTNEFPSLRANLEEKFQQACIRSAKGLGRLRAIEVLIAEFTE